MDEESCGHLAGTLQAVHTGRFDKYIILMYYMHVSPTVAYFKSIRFMIRTNDHPPPHIHAIKGDCEAVVEIQTGNVIRAYGYSERDVAAIVRAVLELKELLQEAWDEIHEE